MNHALTLVLITATFQYDSSSVDDAAVISPAKPDGNGFLRHEIRSPYQAGTTHLRILLPDNLQKEPKYPVVFVLPVESGMESRYGDGLKEVQKLGVHNQRNAIFVAPTFSHLPWYADHPSSPEIRQELYLLKVVVPYVERNYPIQPGISGHRLLGFSKSGWGAFTLLLRNSSVFGKAVAWDAPLMMDKPGKYGSGEIFSTPANFENYRVSKLLKDKAQDLQDGKRLIVLGYGGFRSEHQQAHELMNLLNIDHEYRDGPERKHDWHSGWVKEAVDLLFAD